MITYKYPMLKHLFARPIYLDCYTVYEHIAEFYPLRTDSRGITMRLWTDLCVEIHRDRQGMIRSDYSSADRVSGLQIHDPRQWEGYVDTQRYQHYKILAPWHIEATEPVLFQMTPARGILEHVSAVTVPPGLIDFVNQRALHVNTFWSAGVEGELSYFLPAGTELVTLTALTDRPVVIRTHCITLDEFTAKNYTPKFMGLYRERVRIESKCPFA